MPPPKDHGALQGDSTDDDVSVTSSLMSEPREDYPLERILAERVTANGPEWLVKWEGYPDERSTWEPESSFTTSDALFDWQTQKMRINRGYDKPYNVAAFEKKVKRVEQAQAVRKAKRRAKRIRLGLSVSPDLSEPQSSEEAEESDDERPLDGPSRSGRDMPRKGDPSLDEFVIEAEENRWKKGHLKQSRNDKGSRFPPSESESEDRLSDDSLVEDLKTMEFNKTHKGPKRKVKPRGENAIVKAPEPPQRQKQPIQIDRRRTVPNLPPPQYTGTMNRAKPQLKGARGTGPKRYVKKQPQAQTKPRVQGAAILGNWAASLKPRKRTTVDLGVVPSSDAKTFNKLSVKRRFEKAGRNEPAPTIENLDLFNPRKAKTVQQAIPVRVQVGTVKRPWDMLQEEVKNKAKSHREAGKPNHEIPENDNISMDMEMVDSPEPVQEVMEAAQPPQLVQATDKTRTVELTQPSNPTEPSRNPSRMPLATYVSERIGEPSSQTKPDTTTEDNRKSSLCLEPSNPGHVSVANRQDMDGSLSSIEPGVQSSTSHAPHPTHEKSLSPDSSFHPILATIRAGVNGEEIGATKFMGLDRYSAGRLLRTKIERRLEIWLKISCTADDYKRFYHGQDSHILSMGYVLPFWNTAQSIDAMADALKANVSGGLCFHDSFILLIYPAGTVDWEFIDTAMPSSPETSLRFLMRNPLSQAHRDWPEMLLQDAQPEPLKQSPDEHTITTVFRHLFKVDYKLLVAQNSRKNQEPNTFYLLFPLSCNEEHDLVIQFLEANGATIYSSRTAGSWDYFSSHIDAGVVLIHSTFYSYHTIPSLPAVLKKNINVFSIGTSLEPSLEPSSSPPYTITYAPHFACERLFPHGGAILLTESVFLEDPKAARNIVKWFKESLYKKPAGTWKLVCRPRVRDWLAEVVDGKSGDSTIYTEIYTLLTSLLTNHTSSPISSTDNDTDEDNLITPASLLEPYTSHPTPTLKAAYLVEWFAGWASCHVTDFRRFHVVHTVVVERWMERWRTLEVMTPDEFAANYKLGGSGGAGAGEAGRRKSVGS